MCDRRRLEQGRRGAPVQHHGEDRGQVVERFRAEGVDGLRDRSARPLSLPSQTAPATCAVVEALRRQRHTGKQIAAEVGVSPATVSRILRRLGVNTPPPKGGGFGLRLEAGLIDPSGRFVQTTLKLSSGSSGFELSPKLGDGGNREGGISWGCLTPPLLHRRSDMPCPRITLSS